MSEKDVGMQRHHDVWIYDRDSQIVGTVTVTDPVPDVVIWSDHTFARGLDGLYREVVWSDCTFMRELDGLGREVVSIVTAKP